MRISPWEVSFSGLEGVKGVYGGGGGGREGGEIADVGGRGNGKGKGGGECEKPEFYTLFMQFGERYVEFLVLFFRLFFFTPSRDDIVCGDRRRGEKGK